MDIKAYIASGILENYVFGLSSAQEMQEVECMTHIYPEIKEELTSLQDTIEKVAEKYATPPPIELKSKVLTQIQAEKQIQPNSTKTETATETKIIPISSPSNASSRRSKLMAAASIVALIGVGMYAYFIKSDLSKSQHEFAQVNNSFNALQGKFDTLSQENERINDEMLLVANQMDFIRDENTKKIELTGTANYSSNLATVFWNNTSEKVMLDVKNLPQTGPDESYQLWVLIGGVPQDMGVFDFDINIDSLGLIEMKTTGLADAFAITREPKGGSTSPTLEKLHVIGVI